jgi:hypothetical protein
MTPHDPRILAVAAALVGRLRGAAERRPGDAMTETTALAMIGLVAEIDRAATARDIRNVRHALVALSRIALAALDDARIARARAEAS